VTYWRKNRTIGNKIYLYRHLYDHKTVGNRYDLTYTLVCDAHKFETVDYMRKSDALLAMARPWEWCEECKADLEDAS
jgi:hypothetical protein